MALSSPGHPPARAPRRPSVSRAGKAEAALAAKVAREPQPGWPASGQPDPDGAAVSLGAIEFMGARRLFKSLPQSRAEIHGALVKGLPYSVLVNIVDHLSALSANEIAEAVGISTRTLRRQKEIGRAHV